MYYYCLGIRINDLYQETTCELREQCPYYTDTRLSVALSRPDEYQELQTYNSQPCKYFRKEWENTRQECETSDSQTDGMQGLLNAIFMKKP